MRYVVFMVRQNRHTSPSLVLHSRIVLSLDPDATYFPQGEKHAVRRPPVCPSSDRIMRPLSTSQIFAVLSTDAESTSFPPGENAKSTIERL